MVGLNRLADFIIALVELLEAEGRALRRGVVRLAQALALGVGALVMAAGGAALLLWAFYQWMTAEVGYPANAAATGVVTLIAAGGMAWIASRLYR